MNSTLQTGTLQGTPELHLDADQLSAFLEGTLPGPDREAALRHMAGCADCRELAFLTQAAELPDLAQEPTPALTAIQPAHAGEPIPSLLHSLAQFLGRRQSWAGLTFAAAACCIFSIVFFQYRKPTAAPGGPGSVTAKLSPPPAEPPAPQVPLKSASPASPRPNPRPAPALVPAHRQPTPPLADSAITTAAPTPPQAEAPAPPRALPQPAAIQPLPLASRSYAPAMRAPSAKVAPSPAAASPSAQGYAASPLPPAPAAPQAPTASMRRQAPAAAPPPPVSAVGTPDLPPNIPASQTVTVSAANETVEGSAAPIAPTTGSGGRVETLPPPHVLPSRLPSAASAATGAVLLEFDRAGTLFRSENHGKHWKRIKPAWRGAIQSLQLTPDARFQITTSEGAVWLSKDGFRWSQSTSTPR